METQASEDPSSSLTEACADTNGTVKTKKRVKRQTWVWEPVQAVDFVEQAEKVGGRVYN